MNLGAGTRMSRETDSFLGKMAGIGVLTFLAGWLAGVWDVWGLLFIVGILGMLAFFFSCASD